MTFDRMRFSINKENLIGNEATGILGVDSIIKNFSGILDYEYNKKIIVDEKPTFKQETYNIGTITGEMFQNQIENITLKSKNMMTEKQFDELIDNLKYSKIRLIQTRFYLTEDGYKKTIDWLSATHKAYLEMSSDMYGFYDQKSFLTGFMGNFETKKSGGLITPDTGNMKVYITTIRTRFHEIDTQDSIEILNELKKGTYFLKEQPLRTN
jgi:hypothetical protein